MDLVLADMTRTKIITGLIQGVALLLVPAEVAVDVPPNVPLLQKDLAQIQPEILLTATATTTLNLATQAQQAGVAALEASVVLDSDKAHSARAAQARLQAWE